MFEGFTAPAFLDTGTTAEGDRRQVGRVGTWLVVVTIDGTVSHTSRALGTLAAILDRLATEAEEVLETISSD